MKQFISALTICISVLSFSQVRALTENGQEVVLLDDNTWRFVNENDHNTSQEIATNETVFTKSKDATFLIKSKVINAGIYIDIKKWKPIGKAIIPSAEYVFQNIKNPQALGVVMSEKAPITSLKMLKNIVVSNIEKRAAFFRLLNSEYRTINGIQTLYLKYKANLQGLDFNYASVYYLTEEGYTSIMAYTYEKEFPAMEKEIESLLNGLVKTEKSNVTEVIETAPPPPMINKK